MAEALGRHLYAYLFLSVDYTLDVASESVDSVRMTSMFGLKFRLIVKVLFSSSVIVQTLDWFVVSSTVVRFLKFASFFAGTSIPDSDIKKNAGWALICARIETKGRQILYPTH